MKQQHLATAVMVNGRYQFLNQLGQGTQGAVYEVLDTLTSCRRALKLCNADASYALETEYFHLLDLQHPNIARVYDFQRIQRITAGDSHLVRQHPWLVQGQVFFTEELIDGISADAYVARMTDSTRQRIAVQVGIDTASALRLLHSRGMLHLDVKPSNIIVDQEGVSHLIDLGLALPKTGVNGIKAGTLGYMAPELFDGVADEGTDIYALGQVLLQLLNGKPPSLEIGVPPVIPQWIPGPLASVLRRMVHSRLDNRYSARETMLALNNVDVADSDTKKIYLDDASEAETASSRLAAARATQFVGRRQQVEQLTELMNDAFEKGEARLCVIHGAVGIGKTRLVRKVVAAQQVRHAQRGRDSVTFISGTIPRIAQQLTGRLPEAVPAPLELLIARERKGEISSEINGIPGYISESAMGALLEIGMRQSGPVVILLEDTSSLQFVLAADYLQSEGYRSEGGLVLLFENSELSFSGEFTDHISRISLEPLSMSDEHQMVADIAGVAVTSAQTRQFHQITGGNPRFVEALVAQFFFVSNRYELGDMPDGTAFPEDAGQLLAARLLSNVNEVERDILSILALADGALEMYELQAALTAISASDIEGAVQQLQRAGYLQGNGNQVTLVAYLSKGVRDAIQDASKCRFHRRLFAGLSAERTPAQRGRHAFFGGMCDVAAPLLHIASQRAMARSDMGTAIDCFEMLTQCEGHVSDEDQLNLATCYRRAGKYQEALQTVTRLLRTCEKDEARFELAASLRLNGDVDRSREILTSLRTSSTPLVAASAIALLARIHLDLGELSEGLALVSGMNLSDEQAHQSGMLNVRGLLLLTVGDISGAFAIFQKGLAVAKGGNPIEEGRYHAYLGMAFHAQKEWADAARQYESAFRLADDAGDSHGAATYVVNWAAALTEIGDVQNALIRYRNGMNRLRLVGRPVELVQAESNYAQLLLRLGDARGAIAVSQQALSDMNAVDSPLVHGHVQTVLGESFIAGEQFEDAADVLSKATAIFDARQQLVRRDFCLLHWSEALVHLNQHDEARHRFLEIEDDSVKETCTWFALRVLIAFQGTSASEVPLSACLDELDATLTAATSTFSLEFYQGMAVAAIGFVRVGNPGKSQWWSTRALSLLDEIRHRTPAVHQPDVYPYELQLINLNAKTEHYMAQTTPSTEEQTMKQLWMERLIRIAARLNSELNVDAQLDIIIDTAIDVTGAERGFLLMREDDGTFVVRSARNLDSEAILASEQNYSGTVARRAFELGEPIVTTNAQEDEQYRDYRSVAMLNLMYIVAVPLLVKGEAKGTIYLDSTTRGQFDSERVTLLKMLANNAAIAITNARLMSHVQLSNARIESLNHQLAQRLASTERELATTRQNLREMNDSFATQFDYHGIVGASKPMKAIYRLLDRIAATDIPVVIAGESGTGKELVARAIHQAGTRRDKPFVAENCAAIPSQLLESVLFGHVRGAFTGAVHSRNGLFVEAHNGTLFLDEIADMPIEMQTKLLRVLQDGKVRPVGQNQAIKVDVRILVASNADLKTCVQNGTFREDLYYRLHVMEIRLPPLRERTEDIPMLARYFIGKHAPDRTINITHDGMATLMQYRWPGNVRQLENEIVRATVMCGETMDIEHFSEALREFSLPMLDDVVDLKLEGHVNRLKSQLIRAALKKSGGNRSRASELLGVSRFGLQKMMTRLELGN